MNTLRQYWGRLFSRLKKTSDAGGQDVARPKDLEREVSAISGENRVLAEEVRRVRTDSGDASTEEHRKVVDLQQVRHDIELARSADQRKLAELEELNSNIEAARDADSKKIHDLGKQLAKLESERNQTLDKVRTLEGSLTEAASRLERAEQQIQDLQATTAEQAKQYNSILVEANKRLESTDNRVSELDQKRRNDRQEFLKTYQDMLLRFRKQDLRLNWTITAAGFAILLGTVVGAVMIWDVQRNSALLSSVSLDLKNLIASVNGQLSLQQDSQKENLQHSLPAMLPPVPRTTLAAQPEKRTAANEQPAQLSSNATISKNSGPPRDRAGIRQFTREDARRFFEENARAEGVVSLESGVQYRMINPGSGKAPTLSDKVVVAYVGIKPDGTIFDDTYMNEKPLTFSMQDVLPGWREVLLKMEEGAEFDLFLPPNLATRGGVRKRGMLGYEPSLYRIELLKVVE